MAVPPRMRIPLSNQTNLVREPYQKPAAQPPTPLTNESRFVSEYGSEILTYFLEVERVVYSERMYMSRQSEVTDRMRKILIDWLIDVVTEFKLHPETFFLAVDIIDRFLFFYSIPRTKLQLVGVTAILVAAKHEEIWPPTVNDCVAVTANTYTSREVIDMEFDVVTTLRFKFTVPTTYPITCRLLESCHMAPAVRHATFLFLESAAHCYPLLQFLPSRIAAGAVLLGAFLIRYNRSKGVISLQGLWEIEVSPFAQGIGFEELQPVTEQLLPFTQRLCSGSSRLQAVRRKYSSSEYDCVASLEFPFISASA
ncbi:cyclin [Leishmania infantum JPCM5]|uniref:Cyclin n=2 Tax=Leishmania infantum TaxID=5671 RepID=A0A6L0XKK8_LEIIN|nr:cyclin [Leishmania infantum JPCM5]CAC9494506.1 cyclin [Leishmania infantum]CAM68623.1 cyclin [Leishmania infantum JPCM5]SUZ42482.1 cyclin [Leishmania infantum]|eukprot:XP_001466184.1 cyclin [Leishmania infantum JPCM5]